MDWTLYTLNSAGRLVDGDGCEGNTCWPRFASVGEAEEFLEAQDIRANCTGRR